MAAPPHPPIIVIKKKSDHGGHHGGAWKVAYADFVTAMMALFIVLWLMSTSQEVKESIAGYFRDPKGFGKQTGSALGGSGETLVITKSNMDLLKGKLEQSIRKNPQFDKLKDFVQMTVTGEGLRIELLESDKGTFFEVGEPLPTELGKSLLVLIAKELGQMTNILLIEGHTDARPFDNERYSNWELSSDRANAARRIMQENGLQSHQVGQVRGFADQQLRLPGKPEDPSNRRISIIVQYAHPIEEPKTAAAPAAKPAENATKATQSAHPAVAPAKPSSTLPSPVSPSPVPPIKGAVNPHPAF